MIVNFTLVTASRLYSYIFEKHQLHSNVNSKVYIKGKHQLRTDKYTKDKITEMETNNQTNKFTKQISLARLALHHLLPRCIYKRPNDVAGSGRNPSPQKDRNITESSALMAWPR